MHGMKNFVKYHFVLVALFIFIIHLSYIPNSFIWLDHLDIEGKAAVVPLQDIPRAFTSPYGNTGFYRPMVTILVSLETYVFGNKAYLFHTLHILLHIVVSFLAPLFIESFIRITRKEKLLISLIVGVHSVSWLTVGALTHLSELLMAIFTMTTVIVYAKRANPWMICLSALLAFFSKETAVVLVPAFILLYSSEKDGSIRRIIKKALSVLPALILYITLRLAFVPQIWKTAPSPLSLNEGVGTRLSAVGRLLLNLVMPLAPSNSDAIRIVEAASPQALLTLLVLMIGVFLIWKFGLRHRITTSLLLLGITLSPAFNIVPLPRFYSINYAYVAVIPLSLLVVVVVRYLSGRKKPIPTLATAVLITWILFMSGSTFLAGFRMKDNLALFGESVEKDPNFLEGHFYLGNYYFSNNKTKKAEEHYMLALGDNPAVLAYVDKRAAMVNLAGVYVSQNKLDEASNLLVRAADGASGQQKEQVAYNQALIYARKGDANRTVELVQPFIEQTTNANMLLLWSEAMVRTGKKDQAVTLLEKKLSNVSGTGYQQITDWLAKNRNS